MGSCRDGPVKSAQDCSELAWRIVEYDRFIYPGSNLHSVDRAYALHLESKKTKISANQRVARAAKQAITEFD